MYACATNHVSNIGINLTNTVVAELVLHALSLMPCGKYSESGMHMRAYLIKLRLAVCRNVERKSSA